MEIASSVSRRRGPNGVLSHTWEKKTIGTGFSTSVAATADMKSLWAVDFVNNGLRYTDSTMSNWSSALLRPAGFGHRPAWPSAGTAR